MLPEYVPRPPPLRPILFLIIHLCLANNSRTLEKYFLSPFLLGTPVSLVLTVCSFKVIVVIPTTVTALRIQPVQCRMHCTDGKRVDERSCKWHSNHYMLPSEACKKNSCLKLWISGLSHSNMDHKKRASEACAVKLRGLGKRVVVDSENT